mgnify:CR=1 FL=1
MARKADAETAQRIRNLNLRGIYFQKESKRFYPKRELAAQVLGYGLAKLVGVKVIAELPARRRVAGILAQIALAELALVLFAVLPGAWKIGALLLNTVSLCLTCDRSSIAGFFFC